MFSSKHIPIAIQVTETFVVSRVRAEEVNES